jgi:phosphoglucan,water dikinase
VPQVEQFAFVLLAEAAKIFEEQGHNVDWVFALMAAGSALENGRLSESLNADEAESLYKESRDMLRKPLDLGRYKAWLDRAVRLCTNFSDAMQDLFLAHVGGIGRGLHVDDHAAKVFVEAEVRASVVFQLSRILTAAVKSAKKSMDAPPWSALQPGAASGKLVAYENIADLLNKIGEHQDQPVVAFLNSAEGDEDIPPSVVGVVLGHELPLLSHLGVRARQQGVVFACSDGAEAYNGLKGSVGSLWVRLCACIME